MTIREALGQIAALPYIGNKAGSFRSAKDFENAVTSIMRSVASVEERPNGANGFPTFVCQGIDYMIKTSKGKSPMWNESYVREDSVLILNLNFGTAIVHGSLITSSKLESKLVSAKDFVANQMRLKFPKGSDNFFVTGGRIQFGDNIDWESSKASYLNKTILKVESLIKH